MRSSAWPFVRGSRLQGLTGRLAHSEEAAFFAVRQYIPVVLTAAGSVLAVSYGGIPSTADWIGWVIVGLLLATFLMWLAWKWWTRRL